MNRYQLDVKRMLCPMPVIKTQDKIKALTTGDILDVVCTDPGALHDIPAWCRIHGHQVIKTCKNRDEIHISIEVGV